MSPVWSPDSSRIRFYARRRLGGRLLEKAVSETGVEKPVGSSRCSPVDWSQDGRHLLCSRLGFLSIETDGQAVSGERARGIEGQGQFSPDTRWIAYTSDESGRSEVWVRRFSDGSASSEAKWQISTAGGSQPRWRRDGKELFYVSTDGRLMSVSITTNTTFEYGAPQAMFPVTQFSVTDAASFAYAVSSDGQRFLARTPIGGNRPPAVTVVTNWLPTVQK